MSSLPNYPTPDRTNRSVPKRQRGIGAVILGLIEAARPLILVKTLCLMLIGATYAQGRMPNFLTLLKGFLIIGPMLWGGLYILNDVTDINDDKCHPIKCERPLPSGRASPLIFAVVAATLVGGALVLSCTINFWFLTCAAFMTLKQMAYTLPPLRLKERFIVDILSGSMLNASLRFLSGWFLVSDSLAVPLLLLAAYECFQVSAFMVHRLYSNYEATLEHRLGYQSTVTKLSPHLFRALIIGLAISGALMFLFLPFNSLLQLAPSLLGVLPLQAFLPSALLVNVMRYLLASVRTAESFSRTDLRQHNNVAIALLFIMSILLAIIIHLSV